MAVINAAQAAVKTVADPNSEYESILGTWKKTRAVCNGERFVKEHDSALDVQNFTNLLIPFSPSMSREQYKFYKAEAELPGITAQFSKMILGGLLRKAPIVKLPEEIAKVASKWISNEFAKDDSPLSAFLDEAIWEELQTSRAWVFVDYPEIQNLEQLSQEDLLNYKPFPVLYKAESIINWRVRTSNLGKTILDRIIIRGYKEEFLKNDFHPTYRDTVWVHELDDSGLYQIRVFQRVDETTSVIMQSGELQAPGTANLMNKTRFEEIEVITNLFMNGERLNFIPAWPLNGNIAVQQPVMSTFIDKELALYNKISRRNHLLYGAATYTPVISSDMTDEEFEDVVSGGLGTWIRLRKGDTASVLETPTSALTDMDRAIAAGIEEMAKLGIRMLTPETNQSGVALELRNATQTAQIGSLNNKISNTMKQVIAFMINWRYNTDLGPSDVEFSLSTDFSPSPVGEGWLRLATEWYQQGLIPRSVWLMLLKYNDILPPDYDDNIGREEITEDLEMANSATSEDSNYLTKVQGDK
jgi:hypothetical protein